MTPYLEKLCSILLREGVLSDGYFNGTDWPLEAETMIGRRRLENFINCIIDVVKKNVPGDIIETGVWRGGACIAARGALKSVADQTRRVFVADSFQGLPYPDAIQYPADEGDKHHSFAELAISLDVVKANFSRYDLLDDRVIFLQGWFANTLPEAVKSGLIEKLAVIRLDGDMYSSTWQALDALYSRLSIGGYLIVDDYALPAAKRAVLEWRQKHLIYDQIHTIDWTGVWWQKSHEGIY